MDKIKIDFIFIQQTTFETFSLTLCHILIRMVISIHIWADLMSHREREHSVGLCFAIITLGWDRISYILHCIPLYLTGCLLTDNT